MKALLVIVVALLLVVGAISGVLLLATGNTPVAKDVDTGPGNVALGRAVSLKPVVNCFFCHSEDGSIKMGPSFKGLYGSVVKYDDGSSVVMDETAIRAALKDPNGKIVDGFEPKMPADIDTKLTEEDRVNLMAYMRSLGVKP